MANTSKKDELNYRPKSYWSIDDPLAAILANISGKARRTLIKDHWDAGRFQELHDELLKDELSEETRVQLGRIHPCFMGGEYLPDRFAGEVTIVSIFLQSTTSDVIELRARPLADGSIGLRWVDEYDTTFNQPCEEIDRPFSFNELIDFICESGPDDGSGNNFPLVYNKMNREYMEAEDLRFFTSFGSDFYPSLSAWCAGEVEAWIEEEQSDQEEEER